VSDEQTCLLAATEARFENGATESKAARSGSTT
jgi:hypothetical protein